MPTALAVGSMGYWFVLGLGLADLGFSADSLPDARGLGFERGGPSVERQMLAGEVNPTPESSPMGADSSFWEVPWRPPPLLSDESSGTPGAQRSTFSVLKSGEGVEEKGERVWLRDPSKGELFHCRQAAVQPGPVSRFLLSPWDRLVVVDSTQVFWEEGISSVSFLTELERWLEPIGMPNGTSVSVGVCLDMLGFEEYEGNRVSPLDGRHGTPGIRNLSTGLGVTLRF